MMVSRLVASPARVPSFVDSFLMPRFLLFHQTQDTILKLPASQLTTHNSQLHNSQLTPQPRPALAGGGCFPEPLFDQGEVERVRHGLIARIRGVQVVS